MTSRNDTLFAAARRHIPGGVNSPVRAFGSVGGTPLFFQRGKGARVVDADGKSYLDYVGSWGPLIAGHAHPVVLEAVAKAMWERKGEKVNPDLVLPIDSAARGMDAIAKKVILRSRIHHSLHIKQVKIQSQMNERVHIIDFHISSNNHPS